MNANRLLRMLWIIVATAYALRNFAALAAGQPMELEPMLLAVVLMKLYEMGDRNGYWYDNVPAPVDKNGDLVPLDTRELEYEGTVCHVCGIEHSPSSGQWAVDLVDVPLRVNVRDCTLPDSWERLEQDAAKGMCGYFGQSDDDDSCYDCPAYNRGCIQWRSLDLIRRAKALAGVSDDE